MHKNQALVIFSGGQDSTTCLLQAISQYGSNNITTLTFQYGQRHNIELDKAKWIATDLGVKQLILDISVLQSITQNALMDDKAIINYSTQQQMPNTFVAGRNALFLLYAAIYAKAENIADIIIGVSEADFSGYPDCRDIFIKSMNATINLAMEADVKIKTPLMYLSKKQIWALADEMGYLNYIIEHTHTCYLGIEGGCATCPSCLLRNKGLQEYLAETSKVLHV